LKKLDLVLAWVLVVLGFVHCGGAFAHFHRLSTDAVWFFGGGVAFVEGGFLNILRNSGGRGIARTASVLSNVLLLLVAIGLTIVALVDGHLLESTALVLSLVLVGAETLFSITS
jgi:hypothetical protein